MVSFVQLPNNERFHVEDIVIYSTTIILYVSNSYDTGY